MKNRSLLMVPIILLIFLLASCGHKTGVVDTPSVNQPTTEPVSQALPQIAYAIPSTNESQTKAAMVVATAKDNPAPVGSAVLADNMKMIVLDKVRPADSLVAKGNMFTDTPTAGQEYMFVTISAFCDQAKDKQCSFDTYNFKTLGSDGAEKDFKQVTGIDGLVKYTTFDGGSTLTGILSFLVAQNDPKIVLIYHPSSGENAYLTLP